MYKRIFNESQNLSNKFFIHWTKEQFAEDILKNGFKFSTNLFGKAVYLQSENTKMSYENKNIPLKVILQNSTNYYDNFNNDNAFKLFTDFLHQNNLNKNNVHNYFLKLRFDGLNLLNFKWEPQIVLYNIKKIIKIELF